MTEKKKNEITSPEIEGIDDGIDSGNQDDTHKGDGLNPNPKPRPKPKPGNSDCWKGNDGVKGSGDTVRGCNPD